MTFPGGTHDTVAAVLAARPPRSTPTAVKIIPIPPPQMVANMKVGTMDGYCVGEPWNAVAVDQGIGFTAHRDAGHLDGPSREGARRRTSSSPREKPTPSKTSWARSSRRASGSTTASNRAEAATTLGPPEYVNAPADRHRGPPRGQVRPRREPRHEEVQRRLHGVLPRRPGERAAARAHAIWFLAQYQRLGLLDRVPPNYEQLVGRDRPARPLRGGRRRPRRSTCPTTTWRRSR